jgi:hypothetical protein
MANKVFLYIKMQKFSKNGNVLKLFSNKILGEKKKNKLQCLISPAQFKYRKTIAGAEEEQHIGVVLSRLLYT